MVRTSVRIPMKRECQIVSLLFLAVVLGAPSMSSACPLCKDSVANDEMDEGERAGPTRTARAFFGLDAR